MLGLVSFSAGLERARVDFEKSGNDSAVGVDAGAIGCAVSLACRPGSRFGHLEIVADAALHNIGELTAALGDDFLGLLQPEEIILASYLRWGTECVLHLEGEFSFAIWDHRTQHLFACRDHVGLQAFIYRAEARRFIFSNSTRRILNCDGVPHRVNTRKLAAMQLAGSQNLRDEETWFDGILSLPAGSWMSVSRNQIQIHRYWEPGVQSRILIPRSEEDTVSSLREILTDAVNCRLDTERPAAVLLSGGLDSSLIVSVASQCLTATGRELIAIAATVPVANHQDFPGESEYVEAFRAWPNIRISYVTAGGRGPFDRLFDTGSFESSPGVSSQRYLTEELEYVAAAAGARQLIMGHGGELGITARSERYYAELAVTMQWSSLYRQLTELRRVEQRSPLRVLARQFRDILLGSTGEQPMLLLNHQLQLEFPADPMPDCRTPSLRDYHLHSLHAFLRKHARRGESVPGRMVQRYPLMDRRLLEFCLALPPNLKVRNGYHRYPARRVLDGVLPPSIQWRTTKTLFSPDYNLRYNAQLHMAQDFVASIGRKDPVRSIVDLDELTRIMKPVNPLKYDADALGLIPSTLYMVCFLRQFSEFRV